MPTLPLALQWLGPGHLTALALTILVPLALAWFARRSPGTRLPHGFAYGLAAALIVNKLAVLRFAHQHGGLDLQTGLPMHLCDWATVAAILALVGRWPLAYELAYFWGLAGTLQGVLTPDLEGDFTEPHVLRFFLSHGGIIAAALYLTLGLGLRPRAGCVVRVLLWTNGYAIAAGTVNALTGANYGYLCAKPDRPSLLDHLGPWPLYLASLEVLALLLFLALNAPFFLAARAGSRRRHTE